MTDTPHFNYPFAFSSLTKHAGEVEQDSVDDVGNCVVVALATELGSRVEVPTFGIPDQVFQLQPLSLDTLINAIQEWESRAEIVMSESSVSRDVLVAQIRTVVNVRRAVSGA